ncbi:hypothetical protein Pan44_47710 [Caulifigura coniformis]|uniref:MarR family protein n=1 Tax=Caulifigura coniformis TaxID=2527983 RepID=A0A517SKS6_9PLAN|nr:hypothetical protein Pan44_47710 [Caulifigura coniformis]
MSKEWDEFLRGLYESRTDQLVSVLNQGPRTRTQIGYATGWSPKTINKALARAAAAGLVEESMELKGPKGCPVFQVPTERAVAST